MQVEEETHRSVCKKEATATTIRVLNLKINAYMTLMQQGQTPLQTARNRPAHLADRQESLMIQTSLLLIFISVRNYSPPILAPLRLQLQI